LIQTQVYTGHILAKEIANVIATLRAIRDQRIEDPYPRPTSPPPLTATSLEDERRAINDSRLNRRSKIMADDMSQWVMRENFIFGNQISVQHFCQTSANPLHH